MMKANIHGIINAVGWGMDDLCACNIYGRRITKHKQPLHAVLMGGILARQAGDGRRKPVWILVADGNDA